MTSRVTGSRVLTSAEGLAILKEKEDKKKRELDEKEKRKVVREEKKKEKENLVKKKKAKEQLQKAAEKKTKGLPKKWTLTSQLKATSSKRLHPLWFHVTHYI